MLSKLKKLLREKRFRTGIFGWLFLFASLISGALEGGILGFLVSLLMYLSLVFFSLLTILPVVGFLLFLFVSTMFLSYVQTMIIKLPVTSLILLLTVSSFALLINILSTMLFVFYLKKRRRK